MNRITLLFFAFAFFAKNTYAQEALNLFGNLQFGKYEVGVTQLMLKDPLSEDSNELSIRLWYPATGQGTKLIFADYLDYRNELTANELVSDLSIGIGGKEDLFPKDILENILHAPMHGILDAQAEEGQFPLLVWSLRYGTVEYQCILSEYLASHGYIVAFAEDEPNAPYPWQLTSDLEKVNTINQQIIDINASIAFLKHQQNVNPTKIGLLSWSYGGELAVLTQMDNEYIDVVVGLSSLGFTSGLHLGEAFKATLDFEKINVPYLIMMEKIAPNGFIRKPPDAFDEMHSHSRYISFNELTHGNFNAIEGMIPGILNTDKVQHWSKGGEVAQLGYEVISKLTVEFLNAIFYTSNIDAFGKSFSALKNKLPENFLSDQRPSKE